MRIRYCVLLIYCLPFILPGTDPAFGHEYVGLETKITAGVGVEHLKYEEHVPEISLKSSTHVSNIVARVEGVKRWKKIFIGIDGVLPIANFDNREDWLLNGTPDQTDSLQYKIAQFDAFLGYPFVQMFNPYLGVKSTWSSQQRSDFKENDGSFISSLETTEIVKAYFISLGFKGVTPLSDKWQAAYGAVYNLPQYIKVTNDGVPGWKATGIKGYSWSAYIELLFNFREKVSFEILVCTGQQHWEGSDWQIHHEKHIKWPANDTYFINTFLNIVWSF